MPRRVVAIKSLLKLDELKSVALRIRLLLRYGLKRPGDAYRLAMIAGSEFFDAAYYLQRYNDVASSGMDPVVHYFDHGASELRRPSERFDTAYYLEANPDFAGTEMNPLIHFLQYGQKENRPPIRLPAFYKRKGSAAEFPPQPRVRSIYADERREPAPRRNRYAVFTAVVGGYDDLAAPRYRPEGCDFVVFSDQPLKVEGWKVLPLNYQHPDPTRAARFVKLHPHLYFPQYEHSIWIDANIGVKGDLGLFIDQLADADFIGALPHPLRTCVYEEGFECIERRKDDASTITRHLEAYRAAGIPEHIGLWETNLLVRRHNDPNCIKLMSSWWREIQIGSRRDQLSLPVVRRQNSANIAALDRKGVSAREHPLVTLVSHRPKRKPADPNTAWPAGVVHAKPTDTPLTIGICVHNSLPEVTACLMSVLSTCRKDDRIIVIDDASEKPTADYLLGIAARHPQVQLIRNETNLGYTRSANLIFRAAETSWIVLLNSDTIVPPNALRKLAEAGEQYPRLAIVGPLSNAASWQTVPRLTGPEGTFLVNSLPKGVTPDDMDKICEGAALPVVQFVPLVNGFCMAIRKAALQEIGIFDEERFPIGYGEEDDLCLRAADVGYTCGIATNVFVLHTKSASFTSERRKWLVAAGSQALREKHSEERLAGALTTMRDHAGLKIVRERVGILQRRRIALSRTR